jgi:phosphoribosylformimino-5-aminoimidazole carboxamide ribotide isomerase
MKLIPSMDLRRGRVVRLKKGVDGSEEVYPFPADAWIEKLVLAGSTLVHLVDLDGAFGEARQPELLEYPKKYPGVRFQLGGGLRDEGRVREAIDHGFLAVVGTLAVTDPDALRPFRAEDVVLALDVREKDVVVRGWTESAKRPAEELFRDLRGRGFATALVTDVDRDGLMAGPSLEASGWVASFGFSVQASGGVARLDDLRALEGVAGVIGAISGKALLDGKIPLEDPRTRSALAGETW